MLLEQRYYYVVPTVPLLWNEEPCLAMCCECGRFGHFTRRAVSVAGKTATDMQALAYTSFLERMTRFASDLCVCNFFFVFAAKSSMYKLSLLSVRFSATAMAMTALFFVSAWFYKIFF